MTKRKNIRAILGFTGFLLAGCIAGAQVQVSIAPLPKLQFLDINGHPLSGGCVFTYAAGTTTPQATYTDNTGTTQDTNPVILDAGGRASIWLTGSAYKFAVWSSGGANCSTGTQQYTVDGLTAPNFGVVTVLNSASANTASAGFIRMANGDVIDWRNAGNTANIGLSEAGSASAATGNVADVLDYGDLSHGALQAQAFLDFSGAPAQSGDLRGGNNVCLAASRNAAGNGDVCVALVDNSNVLNLGGLGAGGVKLLSGPLNLNGAVVNGALWVATSATNPAASGVFRCSNNQMCVGGRNAGNTGDLEIASLDALNRVSLAGAAGGSTTNQVVLPKLVVTGGVVNSGAGMMHVRTNSCTSPTGTNSGCNTTVSWPGTWPDTNYTAVCTVDQTGSPSGIAVGGIFNKSTTQMSVVIFNLPDQGAAVSGVLDCIGVHD